MKMNGFWVYTHTTPDGMVYVGMSGEEKTSRRWIKRNYGGLFKQEIALWGWENIEHKVIKDNLTKREAADLEEEIRQLCEKNGVSLNMVRSGRQVEKAGGKTEYNRLYDKEHRNEANERSKRWKHKNRELVNERRRLYHKTNKEIERERHKIYYEKNKEIENERCRVYKQTHKEEIKEYNRLYRERKKQEKQLKEQGYIQLF